jgi:hypothetical protein
MAVPDFRFIGRGLAMTTRRTRRKRRRRMMPGRSRRCRLRRFRSSRLRLRRSRRRRRRDAAAPAARRRSLRRTLPCTSAFRSPLILGSWPAARYTQSPCPCLPIPDLKHGSRLAHLVIATTRHAVRHRSHRPSSASHHSPWNRHPQPSPRCVIYASTVYCSQLLRLYVCMQARVTPASSEQPPAGRPKRVGKVRC